MLLQSVYSGGFGSMAFVWFSWSESTKDDPVALNIAVVLANLPRTICGKLLLRILTTKTNVSFSQLTTLPYRCNHL